MHCCNWAVLSSITCVSVSSRRPRKGRSEADSGRAPLAPGTDLTSYLALSQSRQIRCLLGKRDSGSRTTPLDVRVALGCAAPEPGQPEDREHEADEADGDP